MALGHDIGMIEGFSGAGTVQLSRRRWLVRDATAALAGYCALTVVAMWPAMSDISNTVMGSVQPGDATAGGVWDAWQLLSVPPRLTHTAVINAPHGSQLFGAAFVTALGWMAPLWVCTHIVGPVAAWNLVLAGGLVADGMAMYGISRWTLGGATGARWISFVAGVLYAFSAFHIEEAYAHVGYVYSWIFPLILWTALALLARPSSSRAAVLGTLTGVAAYVDGYYIVFAPLFVLIVLAMGLVGKRWLPRRDNLRPAVIAAGLAAWAIFALPVGMISYLQSNSINLTFGGRVHLPAGLINQRSRLWEYVVPWESSPLWGWLTSGWINHQLAGQKPIETSLYLGSVVVLLAVGFAICALWRDCSIDFRLSPTPRLLGGVLLGSAIVLMLCSVSSLGPVPSFPVILWNLKPLWRTFSRLDVAVDCVVVLLASLGLAALASRRRGRLVAPAVALLAIIDGTAIFPWSSWSYADHTPAALTWLARHHNAGLVAYYPLNPSPLPEWEQVLAMQVMFRHPVLNGAPAGSAAGDLERGIADITDPQTVPALRALQVRYVVLDLRYYDRVEFNEIHLRGLRPLVLRPDDPVRLYAVGNGRKAAAAVTIQSGIALEQRYLPKVERWTVARTVVLGIHTFHPWRSLRVRFWARSYAVSRVVRVYQKQRLLWHGSVFPRGTDVAFTTPSAASLRLVYSPGPVRPHGYQATRGLNLTGFGTKSLR